MAFYVFNDESLSALIAKIKANTEAAADASAAASDVSDALTLYSEGLSETLTEIDEVLTDLDDSKEEKSVYSTATLTADEWDAASNANAITGGYIYGYYLDCEGASDYDSADIVIYPASVNTAAEAGMCPTCDVEEDLIIFYSTELPDDDIDIQIRLVKGSEE